MKATPIHARCLFATFSDTARRNNRQTNHTPRIRTISTEPTHNQCRIEQAGRRRPQTEATDQEQPVPRREGRHQAGHRKQNGTVREQFAPPEPVGRNAHAARAQALAQREDHLDDGAPDAVLAHQLPVGHNRAALQLVAHLRVRRAQAGAPRRRLRQRTGVLDGPLEAHRAQQSVVVVEDVADTDGLIRSGTTRQYDVSRYELAINYPSNRVERKG